MDVAIGVISLVVGHFISTYITENLVTYFGVLIGAAVLASVVLQRYLAAASQLMSVIDTVQLAQTPTTIDSSVCAALMHEPADQSTLDGTFTSYDGLPLSVMAPATVTPSSQSQPQSQPQPTSTSKSAPTCDLSLNTRMASYGT
ncbi:g673 [Coccomyxa elongata]